MLFEKKIHTVTHLKVLLGMGIMWVSFMITQVSSEILTRAKNEAKSPNQSKVKFEYLWVGKV